MWFSKQNNSMSNIYVMVIYSDNVKIKVGSIGEIEFCQGFYGYIGSSRSSNFARLKRHKDISINNNNTRHWHIDYLNGNENTKLYGAYITQSAKECVVSESINLDMIEKFGCSDCDCESHLKYHPSTNKFTESVREGLRKATNNNFKWISASDFEDI